MQEHTPGPWKIGHGCLPGDSGFSIVSDNVRAANVKVVAECWPCTIVSEEHRQEVFANARLIAAAPDLLKALTEFVKNEGGIWGNPTHKQLVSHWLYEKAEGNGMADLMLFTLETIAKAKGDE